MDKQTIMNKNNNNLSNPIFHKWITFTLHKSVCISERWMENDHTVSFILTVILYIGKKLILSHAVEPHCTVWVICVEWLIDWLITSAHCPSSFFFLCRPAGKTERSSYSYGRESNPHCHQVSPTVNVYFYKSCFYVCFGAFWCPHSIHTKGERGEQTMFGFDWMTMVSTMFSPFKWTLILEFNNYKQLCNSGKQEVCMLNLSNPRMLTSSTGYWSSFWVIEHVTSIVLLLYFTVKWKLGAFLVLRGI